MDNRAIHKVTLPILALAATLAPSVARGQGCEASVNAILASLAQCRLKVESRYTGSSEQAGRTSALGKCSDSFNASFSWVQRKYGPTCTATEPADAFETFAARSTDTLAAAAGGAPLTVSPTISVIVENRVQLSPLCMGPSLTFFEGYTPVDIAYQAQKTIQVAQLFGAYQIGFQVNGWYWRSCVAPGDCPNPKNCQNPDNAGQVGIEIASDCSTATLLQNWTAFTCDSSVPNASAAVSVSLQSSSPCTVVVSNTGNALQPTDDCCSCSTCTGSQVPSGQTTHCQ
jgi:hypothetical protein